MQLIHFSEVFKVRTLNDAARASAIDEHIAMAIHIKKEFSK